MRKEQIAVFEELLKDENFKGKKSLKHLLWLNTSTPEFKKGECFKVTNISHRVFDNSIVNFNAEVTDVYATKLAEEWNYEVKMIVKKGEFEIVSKDYFTESQMKRFAKADNCITEL